MRKIIVLSMITLDGVMQTPGGPEEDTSDGFAYGGWTAPYDTDEAFNKALMEELKQTDYLLGRKTFEIWEAFWPKHKDMWPGISGGTKYVLSNSKDSSEWEHTTFLKSIEDIVALKEGDGPDLQVWGSSQLVQLLLEHDLVDDLRLKTYPLTLGQGKKLFGNGTIPAAFTLVDATVTQSGIILANYARAGDVKTGQVGV